MADMSVSGIASGIDWDSMITQLLEKAKEPAYVYLDKRDTLDLKKTSLEEFQVLLQTVRSPLATMKMASTFMAKQVEGERLDRNGSYKGVLTATANSDAAINVYDIEVLQLAKNQINRSNQITGTLGNGLSYFDVNAGGHKVRIDVEATDSLSTLSTKINTKFATNVPPIDMTASVVDDRLVLKSNQAGLSTSTVSVSIHRSVSGNDVITFPVNASDEGAGTYTLDMEYGGLSGGTLTVKQGGTTFVEGEDFDIVNGNEIRWRENNLPYAPAGDSYKIIYSLALGEKYTQTATRAESGDTDTNVLTHTAGSPDITITAGTETYVEGTDFTWSGKSIVWKEGKGPDNGASYEINYTRPPSQTTSGVLFEIDASRSNTDAILDSADAAADYDDFTGKTTRIRANGYVYTQGVDFDIVDTSGNASIQWRPESSHIAPVPGDDYALEVQNSDGTWDTALYKSTREPEDEIDLTEYGFSGATVDDELAGSLRISYETSAFDVRYGENNEHYFYTLSGGNGTSNANGEFTLDPADKGVFTVTWPDAEDISAATADGYTPTSRNVPQYLNSENEVDDADNYTVEYKHNTSTFTLSDDGNGTLAALGLDSMDEDHYTAAQDAILLLDGEKVTRSSNSIGPGSNNELIKGLTLELKAVGSVSLDVSQNAETAVTAVQTFLTAYNDAMTWIQTRLTEKEVDETKKATLDSDDFRMRWGLLNGSSLLRNAKESMRRLTSGIYTTGFTSRTSRVSAYGPMSQHGIQNAGTFSISVNGRTLDVLVDPADTLEDIANKINSETIDTNNNPLFYDQDGNKFSTPLATASVTDGKLTISTGTNGYTASLGGSSSVLTSLGLNYEYTSLSQLGIKLKSSGAMSDDGKAGVLELDTAAFMAALEKNAEDASMVMTSFATQMETYMNEMLNSSQKEVAPGVVTTTGAVVREMNAIDTEIKWIDDYLTEFERKLQDKEKALQAQFSAAEVSLAKMMQQANWLARTTAQLDAAAAKAAS